jgi:DNA-binding PadR family transcriptional regulator
MPLSDAAAGILVMVSLRGPSSPYDLERALGKLARQFWNTGHTQIYSEAARLERLGLLRVERQEGGRRRQLFELTPAGRDALRAWLVAGDGRSMEIRDAAQLRLMASEILSDHELQTLARRQVAIYRERLAVLDALDRQFAPAPGVQRPRMRAVPLGRAVFASALAFWQALADGLTPPFAFPAGETPADTSPARN